MKWISKLLCGALILSVVVTADTNLTYGEGTNTTSTNVISSEGVQQQSITSVKVADAKGKWNQASYKVQFVKDATAYGYVHSIFPDRSGDHMIVVYQTDTKVFSDGKPKDGTIKIASIRSSDGTKVWETTVSNKELARTAYNVQSNGEVFLMAQDDTTFYLYTINEKSGKITRTIQQDNIFGRGTNWWRYWLIDQNQLLVTYTYNNQSILHYFDTKGKLIKNRTITGTVWDAQSNRMLVTDGNSAHYTLSVQDLKGSYIFKKSIDDPGYIWDAYLLPDISIAIESQIKQNESYGYGLTKYNAKGQKQWQHTTMDEPWPYFAHDNQIIDIMGTHKKIVFLNNQGKEATALIANEEGWGDLRNHEIYFTGHTIRIADASTMKWLVELHYTGSEPQTSWLGNHQLAIYNSKNKTISVIHITSK